MDVLVVGGGASGISAGIQSARMGVSAVVLEATPWVGGMLTSAGVSCIDGNYNLRGGIFSEFVDSLAAHYGGLDRLKTGWVSNVNFEPHIGQQILTTMADSSGECLDVIRNVVVDTVYSHDGRWRVVADKADGGRCCYEASVLIDATELGDIARICGVDYRIGMDSTEQTGESIAPEQSNDIIQDLTYVAVLKDYGEDVDMTIEEPEGYDPECFANCALNPMSTVAETGQTIWPASAMITYGALPGGKYMINWPIYGNDYYVNTIDMTEEGREEAYDRAKNFTLCFVYFLQNELGFRNLGLADDEFPTDDLMPFYPYHRESRRIEGEAFLTLDAAAAPYEYPLPYYRTGIAVGDYAVDHHHFRHPDWKLLPDLHFYPIPSFNVPMGVMIPKGVDNLIVAEKSVSVSNLINGATRLQPVVMQIGQAAGALAACAVLTDTDVRSVGVRQVQSALLDAGCYIMPYLDLPIGHIHFAALQRIGATGILRGEGRNVGWSNQTWFRSCDILKADEIYLGEYFPAAAFDGKDSVSVGELLDKIAPLADERISKDEERQRLWESLGLDDYDPARPVLRLEAAVVIDAVLEPFQTFSIDYSGHKMLK